MYTPQQWATVLSNARYKATHDFKINKYSKKDEPQAHGSGDEGPSEALGDLDCRIRALETTLVDFQTAFNNLVDALRETDEKLARAEGMLRFCYAICQSPGVKDLAERTKESASQRLSSFGGFGNRSNRDGDGGKYPQPRPGLGAAAPPSRKF